MFTLRQNHRSRSPRMGVHVDPEYATIFFDHRLACIGIACALYLLAYQSYRWGRHAWKQKSFFLIASMLALLLVGQLGIQPVMVSLKAQALPLDVMQSALASQFKTLHGVSSILYLVQSLLGAMLVINLSSLHSTEIFH